MNSSYCKGDNMEILVEIVPFHAAWLRARCSAHFMVFDCIKSCRDGCIWPSGGHNRS